MHKLPLKAWEWTTVSPKEREYWSVPSGEVFRLAFHLCQGYSVFCHSRESGNPSTMRTSIDSRFRGNDKRLLLLLAAFFLEN